MAPRISTFANSFDMFSFSTGELPARYYQAPRFILPTAAPKPNGRGYAIFRPSKNHKEPRDNQSRMLFICIICQGFSPIDLCFENARSQMYGFRRACPLRLPMQSAIAVKPRSLVTGSFNWITAISICGLIAGLYVDILFD